MIYELIDISRNKICLNIKLFNVHLNKNNHINCITAELGWKDIIKSKYKSTNYPISMQVIYIWEKISISLFKYDAPFKRHRKTKSAGVQAL